MKNKKGIAPLILLVLAGLLIAGVYYGYVGTASLTGSGSYIERPVFKYVKCEAIGSLKYSTDYQLATAGEWLYKPSVSSSYNAKMKVNDYPLFSCPYLEYAVCNSQILDNANCRVDKTLTSRINAKGFLFEINDIRKEEVVWVRLISKCIGDGKGITGATYQIGWVPYGLREYDVLSGSSNPVNPNDCITPSTSDSWKDRFISSDADKISIQISKNVNQQTLQPEEVRWYVSGYVTSASPSLKLTYQGKEAWCRTTGTTGEIYQINTVTVGSGTYKIASPDWSDFLGGVGCCPGQTRGSDVCQSDFTYKSIEQAECGAFKSCGSPNFVPYSEGQLIKYSCVDGKCQSTIKDVECANDYDCKDSNELCDLNKFTCVAANVNLDGEVIKTIPDNIADCERIGGIWRKTTEQDKSLLNYIGIGQPKIIINEYCDMEGTNWVLWIIVVIVIIVIIIVGWSFLPSIFGGLRMVLKSIPILGRVIP